jgi:hypothetical protein
VSLPPCCALPDVPPLAHAFRHADEAPGGMGVRMSARKSRPVVGSRVTADMSQRDIAAAIGVSLGELHRWQQLARIPEDEFERRIANLRDTGAITTASVIGKPAPARGRVQRAAAIFTAMTEAERAEFLRKVAA